MTLTVTPPKWSGSSPGRYATDFIARAEQIHGTRYDYSDVSYTNATTKITIICRIHGPFDVRPVKHTSGQGCPTCTHKRVRPTYTATDFIARARKTHGDKYMYEPDCYTRSTEKAKIHCPEHGDFWQLAASHLRGNGCPPCALKYRRSNKIDATAFIERAHEVHGDRYDYSAVNYADRSTPIIVFCRLHGPFDAVPARHMAGKDGCDVCNTSAEAVAFMLRVVREGRRWDEANA